MRLYGTLRFQCSVPLTLWAKQPALYVKDEGVGAWAEEVKCRPERGTLPVGPQKAHPRAFKALGDLTCQGETSTQVLQVNQTVEAVTRDVAFGTFTGSPESIR